MLTLGRSYLGAQGAGRRVAMEMARGVHARRPRRHIVEHVVRVEVGRASVSSGWLQAELVTGPKTKFEARELLFIFHLETKVIRALQQRVIKPQTASVSVLTTTSKRSN